MTLDKAIKHAEEVADRYKWFKENYLENKEYKESAEEHRQLAEWLKDYKRLLEQEPKTGHWILVSEGTPKENETVIASTKYGVYPEARYSKEYGWEWAYEAGADYWRELEDVEAWTPLPKPYEPQESEDKDADSY